MRTVPAVVLETTRVNGPPLSTAKHAPNDPVDCPGARVTLWGPPSHASPPSMRSTGSGLPELG